MKTTTMSSEKNVEDFLGVFDINDGSIITMDKTHILLFEIIPLNRDLLSLDEQVEIINNTTYALKDLVTSYDFNSKIYPVDNTNLIKKHQKNLDEEKDQTIKGYLLEHIDYLSRLSAKRGEGERKYVLAVPLYEDVDIKRKIGTLTANLINAFDKYKCTLRSLKDNELILDSILFAKMSPNVAKIDMNLETGKGI